MAIGAPFEDGAATGVGGDGASNGAYNSGAVYVFERSATGWTQEAYIKPSNTNADDNFGMTIALSADGSRLAIAAPRESARGTDPLDNTRPGAGAAYIFARTGTTWAQEAYVKPASTVEYAAFGSSVSLDAGAGRLAVGSPGNSAACVFVRTDATWTQEACLSALNGEAAYDDDVFGWSVSLSGDGSRLAVGAPQEGSNATGVGGDARNNRADASGAAYVFDRTDAAWAQTAYIKASNTGANDYFGSSVSLAADGGRLAVGARGEASNATGVNGDQANDAVPFAGAAYVFDRADAWAQTAYIKPSNPDAEDLFGFTVSLAGDGTRLAVGAFDCAALSA